MNLKLNSTVLALSLFLPLSAQTNSMETGADGTYKQYDIHPKEVMQGIESFEEISMTYNVPEKLRDSLRNVLIRRELRISECNSRYGSDIKERVKAKMNVRQAYQDSIDIILIPYNQGISGDNISYALKAQNVLKLDDNQKECLNACAVGSARKLRKDPRMDTWDEEISTICATLSERQQYVFFSLKNATSVSRELNTAWKKVSDAGYAEQVDSAEDCAKAYMYLLERQKIKDICHGDKNTLRKRLCDLGKRKPLLLRMVDGIEKEERTRKKNENDKQLGKEFIW